MVTFVVVNFLSLLVLMFLLSEGGKAIWESSGFLLVVHLFAIVAPLEVLLGCVRTKGMALHGKPEEPGKGHHTFSTGP